MVLPSSFLILYSELWINPKSIRKCCPGSEFGMWILLLSVVLGDVSVLGDFCWGSFASLLGVGLPIACFVQSLPDMQDGHL